MRMFLRKTKQILVERDVYKELEKERKQAIADRQVLGEELVGLGAKLGEKEKEVKDMKERYKEIEKELEEEKLRNEEYERKIRECEGEEEKLNKLVERATRMVSERKSL